jgi:hypothetical protein
MLKGAIEAATQRKLAHLLGSISSAANENFSMYGRRPTRRALTLAVHIVGKQASQHHIGRHIRVQTTVPESEDDLTTYHAVNFAIRLRTGLPENGNICM